MMDLAPPAGSIATGHASAGKLSMEAGERALLSLVSAGDRCAMEQLYIRYFARLAQFFQNVTTRADLAEELINDTMLEVWKERGSISANMSVLPVIMGAAYSRVQKQFAKAKADDPHLQRAVQDTEHSRSLLTIDTPSDLQIILSKLPVEERAVVHLVYASGCSRRETADIMNISCDCVDALLSDVRACAQHYFRTSVTSAQAQVSVLKRTF